MHNNSENLHSSSTVAVVGLGKVGLPLAVQYAQHGWQVIGCDTNHNVVEMINAGHSPIQEEPELSTGIAIAVARSRFSATQDITKAVSQAEVVIVIVPVTLNNKHEVDFAEIDAVTAEIGAGLTPDTLVIYETTLPVGTTARRFAPMLEHSSHLRAGHDFFLAYSPERVSCGTAFRDLRNYPKIVGAINERSAVASNIFYRSTLEVESIILASMDEAEFVKLIETTYRDVNIALANEYACYADTHGLNVTTAIAAANTQPYSHIHTPGVGVGGHCLPVSPYFLFGEKDSEIRHQPAQFLLPRTARHINDGMANYAVQRLRTALGSLTSQIVLILGVAYRGDVHDDTFSTARLLQTALQEQGAKVYVSDPLFSETELHASGYTPLPKEMDGEVNAIILQSAHQVYQDLDWKCFSRCQVVLDGRGVLQRAEIEAFGMRYLCIGS